LPRNFLCILDLCIFEKMQSKSIPFTELAKTFLLVFLGFITPISKAQFSDSVTVTTHNKVLIQTDPSRGVNDYYGWGKFPSSGNYQKMVAELTFQCPPGMTCGEWDYNNHIRIGKRKGKNNDSLGWEIMRLITPYGLGFNSTWKHTWKFDITDFQSLFRDSVEIWYQHSGYEARNGRGWLITLNFTLYEGPSIQEALGLQRMYFVNAPYGNDSLFDARVPVFRWKGNPNTKTHRIKIIQTGHGMDQPDNCAEFCPRRRYLNVDGKIVDTSWVWRDDCGLNPVYPQNGTWLYDRAGWCPGQSVIEYNYDIKNLDTGWHEFDLDMDSYVRTGGSSTFVIGAYLLELGDPTYQIDASMVEILKPNNHPQYSRMNPSCGDPLIQVKNTGAKTINYLEFDYGIVRGKKSKHTWSGIIPFGETREIRLPWGMDWTAVSNLFEANITKVNNQIDEDQSNNAVRVTMPNRTPLGADKMIVVFKTNNAPTENSYRFLDAEGKVFFEKKGFTKAQTIYRDTFSFPTGCYTFHFSDTGSAPASYPLNKDGLGWWANTSDGTGSLQLRNGISGTVFKSFPVDFGTELRFDFTVGYFLNQDQPKVESSQLKAYPNPASEGFAVEIPERFAKIAKTGQIEIRNTTGQVIYNLTLESGFSVFQWINTEQWAKGVYIVNFKQNNELCTTKVVLY